MPEKRKKIINAQTWGLLLLLAGLLLSGLGLLWDGKTRFAAGYLLGFCFLWSLVLGGLFFVALQHLTNSMWSIVVRRLGEAVSAAMIWVAVAFVPVAGMAWWMGHGQLPWRTHHVTEQNQTAQTQIAADIEKSKDHQAEPLERTEAGKNRFKEIYYNFWFWLGRTAVYFLAWLAYARFFIKKSLRQDGAVPDTAWALRARMKRASAPFMLVFAGTLSFAAIDWLMSRQGEWFSTIFPVYVFAGVMLTGHAAVTLLSLLLRRAGVLAGVIRAEHLYTMGALLFGFSCFWAYIAFSQFLLIWYGNLPEEIDFFQVRTRGGWLQVTWLVVLLRFIIPFIFLLSRTAKDNPLILTIISVLILAGQWLDLYWLIIPTVKAAPVWGWAEFGPALFWLGALVLACTRFFRKNPVQAAGDPVYHYSKDLEIV